MHAPYDRSRQGSHRTKPDSGIGILILPAILAFVLAVLAASHPKSSIWISQAVQAESGGYGVAEDVPVDTAQPGMTMPLRTVHAD